MTAYGSDGVYGGNRNAVYSTGARRRTANRRGRGFVAQRVVDVDTMVDSSDIYAHGWSRGVREAELQLARSL